MAEASVKPLEWMRSLRDSGEFTGGPLNVLLMLALRMRKDGTGFASQRQLAEDAGVSESTVKRALKTARESGSRESGWVEQTRRGHRLTDGAAVASEYRLLDPTQPATGDTLDPEPTGHGCDVGNGSQQVISEANRSSVHRQQVTGDPPRGLLPEVLPTRVPLLGSGSTDVDREATDGDVENLAVTIHGRRSNISEDEAWDRWDAWKNATAAEKLQARLDARDVLRSGEVVADAS